MNDQEYDQNDANSSGASKATVIVLVIALIITAWGWYSAADQAGGDSFEDQLAVCEEITTQEEVNECADQLQEFTETLQEYAQNLQDAQLEESTEETATGTQE